MESNLRDFGTIISGNRQPNHEINPETRATIISAVTAGEIALLRCVLRSLLAL